MWKKQILSSWYSIKINLFQNRVIKALSEDLNKVAKKLSIKQLAKINKALKMEYLPSKSAELARIPSDDDIFEIAQLDLEKNKLDAQILSSTSIKGFADT